MVELADVLKRIVAQRRSRIEEMLTSGSGEVHEAGFRGDPGATGSGFLQALRSARGRAIIAEVKLGSPRLGSLAATVDPQAQARIYSENGAACLSVVVEPDFFFGSYEMLARCREVSDLPTLAKDFVVHPVQIEWAQRAGADAVLLIAALLSADELRQFADTARGLGMVPLVECHSEVELAMLRGDEWEMVGINNRDLRTFEVSLDQSIALLSDMPVDSMKIAESGIKTGGDVARLEAAGFGAFLVGESLLLSADPAGKLRELVGLEANG